MTQISKELSNKFANMALLCAILVVGIHLHLNPMKGTVIWHGDTILFKAIASVAVPFFFMASGYFLAAHCREEGWWARAIKRRLVTLGVPYLFWCSAWWLCFFLLVPIAHNLLHGAGIFDGITMPSASYVFRLYGLNPFDSPATPALWYVRALLMYVLISPILLRLANKKGVCLLFVTYLIVCPSAELIKVHHRLFLLRFFFSLEGLFYFTLGMFLRITQVLHGKKERKSIHFVGFALLSGYLFHYLSICRINIIL